MNGKKKYYFFHNSSEQVIEGTKYGSTTNIEGDTIAYIEGKVYANIEGESKSSIIKTYMISEKDLYTDPAIPLESLKKVVSRELNSCIIHKNLLKSSLEQIKKLSHV
jgi:Mor family transcriptional regulator